MPNENPYRSPGAPPANEQQQRGKPGLAILAGTAADLGGSILFAFLQAIIFAVVLDARGMNSNEVAQHLGDSSLYFAASLVLGLSMDVLGGYVTARIANHNVYQYALITAGCVAILGQLILGSGLSMSGFDLLATIAIFPLACLGANLHLRSRQNVGGSTSNSPDDHFEA